MPTPAPTRRPCAPDALRRPAIAAATLVIFLCGAAVAPAAVAQPKPRRPAIPQTAPAVPADPPAQSDEGDAGDLPGTRFQRRLDGGPGFVCTATNARHDQQCTASCRAGETADCVDGDGSSAPSCACTKG